MSEQDWPGAATGYRAQYFGGRPEAVAGEAVGTAEGYSVDVRRAEVWTCWPGGLPKGGFASADDARTAIISTGDPALLYRLYDPQDRLIGEGLVGNFQDSLMEPLTEPHVTDMRSDRQAAADRRAAQGGLLHEIQREVQKANSRLDRLMPLIEAHEQRIRDELQAPIGEQLDDIESTLRSTVEVIARGLVVAADAKGLGNMRSDEIMRRIIDLGLALKRLDDYLTKDAGVPPEAVPVGGDLERGWGDLPDRHEETPLSATRRRVEGAMERSKKPGPWPGCET